MLDKEKLFMEAAKRNDVETMKTLGRGLNTNAKNVVGLNRQTVYLTTQYTALYNITQTHSKVGHFWDFCKNLY